MIPEKWTNRQLVQVLASIPDDRVGACAWWSSLAGLALLAQIEHHMTAPVVAATRRELSVEIDAGNDVFHRIAALGTKLRELHLMKKTPPIATTYPVSGHDKVEKVVFREGQLWINRHQYFGGVNTDAWELFIGGYRPAYQWLQDRRGRVLTDDDMTHFQRIVAVLTETARLVDQLDAVAPKYGQD